MGGGGAEARREPPHGEDGTAMRRCDSVFYFHRLLSLLSSGLRRLTRVVYIPFLTLVNVFRRAGAGSVALILTPGGQGRGCPGSFTRQRRPPSAEVADLPVNEDSFLESNSEEDGGIVTPRGRGRGRGVRTEAQLEP